MLVLCQSGVQLPAGADTELGKDLSQVPFDRPGGQVQLRADLGVGAAVAGQLGDKGLLRGQRGSGLGAALAHDLARRDQLAAGPLSKRHQDRKSTRLNSSHVEISYAVFCLKKKKK